MSDSHLYTRDEQINDVSATRPHLVVLGAGASVAAFPDGDANGNRLPVMMNLVDMLDLGSTLDAAGIKHADRNFEEVYAEIASTPTHEQTRLAVEERVSEYFSQLQLPGEPTLYDYLVLSLRPKDAIATFNWDPFLWQALKRNREHTRLPKWFFLHGCAVVGCCEKDKQQGENGYRCPQCHELFTPTRMLYPVTDKDYASDGFIASQWTSTQAGLSQAFLLTIFGYGAPTSDAAAIDLMSGAWGVAAERRFEEIEIIDIRQEDDLVNTWEKFVHSHHYTVSRDYFDSILGQYPRRSVEAYWQSLIQARFREENPVPRDCSLKELWEWFDDLLEVERNTLKK